MQVTEMRFLKEVAGYHIEKPEDEAYHQNGHKRRLLEQAARSNPKCL